MVPTGYEYIIRNRIHRFFNPISINDAQLGVDLDHGAREEITSQS